MNISDIHIELKGQFSLAGYHHLSQIMEQPVLTQALPSHITSPVGPDLLGGDTNFCPSTHVPVLSPPQLLGRMEKWKTNGHTQSPKSAHTGSSSSWKPSTSAPLKSRKT